jgi:hypothetical protein
MYPEPIFADELGFACFSVTLFLCFPVPVGFVAYWVGRAAGKREAIKLLDKMRRFFDREDRRED